MDARRARQTAKEWIEDNRSQWPGLRAAHLIGGITTMPDDAPFPAYKDVDIHLIFAPDSTILQPTGPFMNIIETVHAGMIIEAGIKSAREYASPEVVLANPEIAHHLTVNSALYDPDGMLAALYRPVTREYPRRRWVRERVAFERRGLEEVMGGLLPMARAMGGLSGGILVLGYSLTYLGAALPVAALRPPRIGSGMLVHLRNILTEHGRPDLYEESLAVLGVQDVTPERVEELLAEGAALFDRAVPIRRTPNSFQHKLHAHMRPYFVESCRAMLDAGNHREALGWVMAYSLACYEVMLADGPEVERPTWAARQAALLAELGITSEADMEARVEQARGVQATCFAVADEIVLTHAGIVE